MYKHTKVKSIFLLLMTSILFAFSIDKNSEADETAPKIPIASRVIISEGAKVIVGTHASAKLLYGNLVLLSDAKLIYGEEIRLNQFDIQDDNNDNKIYKSEKITLPSKLSISKAYPNPFNPVVNISYGLPDRANVRILIHDLNGRKIADFSFNQQSAGWHEFNWNAVDQKDQAVGSGIYLLTIQAGDKLQRQKITYIK